MNITIRSPTASLGCKGRLLLLRNQIKRAPWLSCWQPIRDTGRSAPAVFRGEEMSCANKVDFNFGTTTADEVMVCGAARPGAKQQRCYTEDLRVPAEEVAEWVQHMKAAGVQRVISMLSESELKTYAGSLPAAMEAAFGEGRYVNVDAKSPGGPAAIMSALQAARAAGEKALVHCWGGGGRTGLVQAAWLVAGSGLTPEAAAEAVTAHAAQQGMSRRVDVGALKDFLAAAGAGK